MALPWTITTTKKETGKVLSWEEGIKPLTTIEVAEQIGYPILKAAPPKEEIKDTWLKRIARIILPRNLEVKLGITEPSEWDLTMQREDARLSYLREKQFTDLYKKEITEAPQIPQDYKEPTSFTGQFLEGIKAGYISSVKGGFGYFVESLGRQIGSPERLQWGANLGDRATIELIKRPELLEPEDLKPFFEGGWLDRTWWGRRIGQTLPFMGTAIGTATLGGLIGGPAGAYIGGFTSVFAMEKGNSYQRYLDEGVPPDKADIYSNVYGSIAAIIENAFGISPARIGTQIATKGAERVIYDSYKSYLLHEIPKIGIKTLKMATVEGGEEIAQGITENLVLKFYQKEAPIFSKDLAEEFAGGFAAAIPFGAVNIRIPEIRAITPEEIKTSEEAMKRADELLRKTKEKKPEEIKLAKFPENKYKLELLEEIGKLKELPKIDPIAFEWQPSTISYNNPYTRTMYKVWNKIGQIWDTKAPLVLKEAQTREISQLLKERQRVYDGLVKRYYEETIRPLTKLTTQEKQKVGEMIFKRIEIPTDYVITIKNIDTKIGQLGQAIVNLDKEMISKGFLKKEMGLLTEETWLSNLGEYARTLYVKVEDGKTKITPRSALTKEGIIDRSAFKRKLTDQEWGANALAFEGKTLEEIGEYLPEELASIGVEAKEKYGWTFQADYILARTFQDLSRVYATRLFQKTIVENPRLFSKTEKEGFIKVTTLYPKPLRIETPTGWVTFSQSRLLGPLVRGYVHPGLQEELRTMIMGKGRDSIMAIFQEPLSWWKAFKVAGNPPTVIRNWLSGAFFQTDLAGYPVWTPKQSARYLRAVKAYVTKDALYKKLRDGGQYGADYFAVEISQDEMARIIAKAEKSNNPMLSYSEGLLSTLGTKLKDIKQLFSYYGHIDHIQRTYLASSAMGDGASVAQAVHFANKWELDYRFPPRFVESLRKGFPGWLYPFLSFYSLMAPRIAEVLITRPWVLIKYPIIIGIFNAIAASILGADDDEIKNAKPEWLKDNEYVVLLPTKDNEGNFVFLDMEYAFPFGGPTSFFMDWNVILQMLKNPGMMNIVMNLLNNYDNFTERKIYNETDLPEDKTKKIAEYVARNLGPGFVTHALNIYRAAKGEIIGFPLQKERDLAQTVARSLGVSMYSGGFNEAFGKIRNIQQEISDIQWAIRILMSNPNISFEEKQRKMIEYQDEIRRRTDKIQEISKAMPTSISTKKEPTKVVPWE